MNPIGRNAGIKVFKPTEGILHILSVVGGEYLNSPTAHGRLRFVLVNETLHQLTYFRFNSLGYTLCLQGNNGKNNKKGKYDIFHDKTLKVKALESATNDLDT